MATHENGVQIRYSPLGIAQLTLSGSAQFLPSIPNAQRVRRVIVRGLGQPWEWRDDGVAPTGANGFRQLADEIVVFDQADFTVIQLVNASTSTGNVDLRVAYYGL